ncbi:ATP-dependent DNA helicase RecG [Candidatus Paracaedibacter symbiosus]|uniref:ATP-dependent DNA helicase RecG n=1 Tax=Candidatus Paracaedibacter symbiosus TaxID=244582 RepID=UPI000509B738|nr:ATP-dependent DNA helicase RecG [Candidatus Paracaedibacter symbiosus]
MQNIPIHPLFAPLETLPGIEGRRKSLFQRLLGARVVDALLHLPSNIIQYRPIQSILQAESGENIIIEVDILSHTPSIQRTKPYKIMCTDGRHTFEIIYFNAVKPYLQKLYPVGARKIIIGKVDRYLSQAKIAHPDAVLDTANAQHLITHEVIYPLTTGVTNKCVQRAINQALSRIPNFPDWLDEAHVKQHGWPSWREAILAVHAPKTTIDLSLQSKFRQRLAFDEFLSHQLGLQLARQHQVRTLPGLTQKGGGQLVQKLLSALPFELTDAQKHVVHEIFEDMALPHPMSRLIQGDVGSGKTVVALIAMLKAIEAGNQAAMLAPTDILARQHAETIIDLVAQIGVRAAILTAREKGKAKTKILDQLASGEIDLIIGTHAIIQDKVEFKKLGLAVIDEQHRFGVEQRLQLSSKGYNPDVLAMTATPIPRTLQLANYGDMDVSIIAQKPAGRLPIQTKVINLDRLEEIVEGAKRALEEGAKIFWVCPLVKESEALDLSAAEDRFLHLQQIFETRVGLVHGQMKAQEKDAVMDHFINGNVDILIATTVIEVGVNVPAATIMIIEHAERFGLAQLHQLRGRIGRGDKPGTCILLYGKQLSQVGRKRLETMRETSDGFKIAEADLKLRGGGDVLGTRQSGMPGFKIADFVEHPEICSTLLSLANKEARRICKEDPLLETPKGQALAFLLKLFGRDEAMKYTRS